MSATLIQAPTAVANGASTGSRALAYTSSTTSGKFLVLLVAAYAAVPPTLTVTYSDGADTVLGGSAGFVKTDGVNLKLAIYYIENCHGGASKTWTVDPNGASSAISIAIAEFSGVATSSTADNQSGAGPSTGTSMSTGTITAAQSDLFVGIIASQTGNPTYTPGASAIGGVDGGGNIGFNAQYDNSAIAEALTWSMANTSALTALGASFKNASSISGGSGGVGSWSHAYYR